MKTLRIRSLVFVPFVLAGCPDSGGGDDGAATDPPADGLDDGDDAFDDGLLDGFLDGIGDPADPCAPRAILQISNDHGHRISEGNELQFDGYFELGGAGHTHGIPVSEQQIEAIFNGGLVVVETETASLHTHKITAGINYPCGDLDGGLDGQIPPGLDDEG